LQAFQRARAVTASEPCTAEDASDDDDDEGEREQVPKLPGSALRLTAPTANMMPVRGSDEGTATGSKMRATTVKASNGGSKTASITTVGSISSRKTFATRSDAGTNSTMTAKASTGSVAKSPKESTPRKQRPRVDSNTPKQSREAHFKNLSQRARYQNYGTQNEPPADVSKLVFLDPKSGRPRHLLASSSLTDNSAPRWLFARPQHCERSSERPRLSRRHQA
jgi:hypothetical protein